MNSCRAAAGGGEGNCDCDEVDVDDDDAAADDDGSFFGLGQLLFNLWGIFYSSVPDSLNGLFKRDVFIANELILDHLCEGEGTFDATIDIVVSILSEVGVVDVDVFINVSSLGLSNPSPIRDRTFDASQCV
jgi:hypothetical protein